MASGVTDEILHFDGETGDVIARTPVDLRFPEVDEPHGLAEDPRGRYWYATVAHGTPTLWKFDGTHRLVGRLQLPTRGAARIGITPDGERAFIPDYYRDDPTVAGQVAVVGLTDLQVISVLSTCIAPHHAAVSPDGRVVAVTCSMADSVALIDAHTLAPLRTVGIDADGPSRPLNIAWADDRAWWVTVSGADEIRQYDLQGRLLNRQLTGAAPAQIAFGPTLAVVNRGAGTLSTLNPDGSNARTIPLGVRHPHGVDLSRDGRRAYVSYEGGTDGPGGVVAVDLVTGERLWRTDAGAYGLGVLALRGTP